MGFCTLRFITTNVRWAGDNGCETAEELMAKAVRELQESLDLLGTLLIEIIEEMEKASVVGGWEKQTCAASEGPPGKGRE